jgi:VanZ family protein
MTGPKSSRGAARRPGVLRIASLIVPPLAVMTAIFILSAQTDFAPTEGFWETFARKCVHVLEYFVLTLCWCRALWGLTSRLAFTPLLVAAAVLSLAYATSDEIHQSHVNGRHGTARDVLIDGAGIALAAGLFARLYARRRRIGPSRPSEA